MDYALMVLTFHIWGAIALGILLSATAITLYKNYQKYYRLLAIILAVNTAQLTATGLAMLFVFPEQGLVSFCTKMVVYLSIWAVAEYAVIKGIKAQSDASISQTNA